MKKVIFTLCLIGSAYLSYSQTKNSFDNHQFSIDFGSFRNRYLFPINDIRYCSPVFSKFNIRFSVRVRSYGTLYFFSKIAYDFTPIGEIYFTQKIQPVYFSARIGFDTRIRLLKDERSQEISSLEPLICLAIHGNYKKFSLTMPLWTRFYSNGISFALMPEISYLFGKRLSIFYRYEGSLLSIYKAAPSEYRQDMFIGATVLF